MPANPAEEMQRDRIVALMERNRSLGLALMGLSRQFLRQCDKYGWSPSRLRIRTPHVDGRGFVEVKYWPERGRGSRYMESYSADTFGRVIANRNEILASFLRRCRPWRVAIEAIYGQGFAFSRDKGCEFEALEFGAFHIETARRRAWCWIATSGERNAELSQAGVM